MSNDKKSRRAWAIELFRQYRERQIPTTTEFTPYGVITYFDPDGSWNEERLAERERQEAEQEAEQEAKRAAKASRAPAAKKPRARKGK